MIAIQEKPQTQKSAAKEEKIKTSAPKVSVIIPAYNVADYIAETLDSALAQTFRDNEIIVINDGSPDSEKLEKAIEPYREKIVYLKQPNKGAAAARNAGIEAARGEILAFLDGDDIWLPDYLEKQISFLRATGGDMVYCDAFLFGDEKKYKTYMSRSPSRGEVTPCSLLNGSCNVITSGTVLLRGTVLAGGMFDEKAPPRIEDFDLWFRLLKNGAKVDYQKNVLLKYRIRAGSLSGNNIERVERSITALKEVKQKHALTPAEEAAWHKQLKKSEQELAVQKGKMSLIGRDYGPALTHFQEANRHYTTIKLSLITALTKFSPQTARWIFWTFRAGEAESFITDRK